MISIKEKIFLITNPEKIKHEVFSGVYVRKLYRLDPSEESADYTIQIFIALIATQKEY